MKKQNKSVTDSVMDSIKEGDIKIKSKVYVLIESMGLAGLVVLFIFLIILTLNVIFHSLINLGAMKYLGLGKLGLIAFLGSFPYVLVFVALMFFVFASYLIKNYDISYKQPYLLILTFLLFFTTASSIALAKSKANSYIQSVVSKKNIPGMGQSATNKIPGIIGRVTNTDNNSYLLQSGNTEVKVTTDENTKYSYSRDIRKNDTIVVVGDYQDGEIHAKAIKHVSVDQKSRRLKKNQN